MVTEALLGVVIVLLAVLIGLSLRKNGLASSDLERAVTRSWLDLGLEQKIGAIATHAESIRGNFVSLEQMMRAPAPRGAFGELALEAILSDQLPPDMYGIRQPVMNGRMPDAHVVSTVGIICIDSKFPLDNYLLMLDAGDEQSRLGFKRRFLRDMRRHLEKVAGDYVCPHLGSAEFAFAYIPSESVYWFLVTEAYQLLRLFTRRGVQVVSPLTMSHKIELIKAGVHARRLSEQAQAVQDDIIRLGQHFREVDRQWRKLYQTHLKNVVNAAEGLNTSYDRVKGEFDRIASLADE
jgi:DNA recombination protein RmuC